MQNFFLFFLLNVSIMLSAQEFDTYFEEGALRIDFLLIGTHNQTSVSIVKLKKESYFGGSKTNLIYPEYGTFRAKIKDAKSNRIVFAKGFSPIFDEWQTTVEAKEKIRAFENIIRIPFPKSSVIFELQKRNSKGAFTTIFTEVIDPTHYAIIRETPVNYQVTELYKHNLPNKAIDLAIVAEGYTNEQMVSFVADAKRLVDYMFSKPPFDKYKNKFNVYAIQSLSQEAGTDISGEGIYRNTILNSHFYTFDSPRYLTTPSLFTLADITALVPCDQAYVLVNTQYYGGGGFYNAMSLVAAQGPSSEKVFVHEFGHAFAGLADEYYEDSAGMEISPNFDIEPWQQNVTTLINFSSKWKDLVSKKTPIPTPRTPKYQKVVGAFEGGNYQLKGIYSPVQNCLMKTLSTEHFCPVCQRTIEQIIKFHCQ